MDCQAVEESCTRASKAPGMSVTESREAGLSGSSRPRLCPVPARSTGHDGEKKEIAGTIGNLLFTVPRC
jgi:hypothetical protein